jgi:DNA-nicking Smr family endonuclease
MKKKKQHEPKPKEFAATPFAVLKGIKTAAPEPVPGKRPEPAARRLAELDDSDAFLLAMAGVQRLGSTQPATRTGEKSLPAKAIIRKIEESEQQFFLDAVAGLKFDVKFTEELPEEPAPTKPRAASRLKQLRRGTIRVDYELDLHGLTRDEALEALGTFVKGAYRRGQQAVLVITGRGNHSADEPVLKKAVEKWLRESGKDMVAEYLPAPRQMGGDGAVVIFLKRLPETPAGHD